MIKCHSCGKENFDGSRFCDQCGTRLITMSGNGPAVPEIRSQTTSSPNIRAASVTSVGIPPLIDAVEPEPEVLYAEVVGSDRKAHAKLVIERGEHPNTEFPLSTDETNIGRWDADNGIFPDVDLDAHDPDAKVSRRHARIIRRDGAYMIEDLGSTNGTFVNRGRRLLPGNPQLLSEGDEIIVGKTFLRFHVN